MFGTLNVATSEFQGNRRHQTFGVESIMAIKNRRDCQILNNCCESIDFAEMEGLAGDHAKAVSHRFSNIDQDQCG